jgi:hypothetical protein
MCANGSKQIWIDGCLWMFMANHLPRALIMNGYSLVNVNKKLWKITMFNGKINYFYGHSQLQTVCLPEGIHPYENGLLGPQF